MTQALRNEKTIKHTIFDDVISSKHNTAPASYDTYTHMSQKIGDINVHIKSSFYPDKNLYDALFNITNMKLKENPAV